MDKSAIKKYAVWARRELISRVSQKALQYGISEKNCGDANADTINGHLLTAVEKKQRQALIVKIEKDGYQQAMEEAAYTWFNRFCALRYMEVNGYLPTRVRAFTDEQNNFKPQIIAEAIHLELDGLDMEKVYALKEENKTDELYKYLLITQCNALSAILPGMFQKIADYTELLFPDHLLREGSAIEQMIALIPEEDWTDQVQIIGWLYQYYNTEPKDKVFADLKKNIKISKENIPAATQLFTPDWIVHYMVENSLGRIAISSQLSAVSEGERMEQEKAIAERMGWKYYLPEAEQTLEVRAQLTTNHCPLPTELRVIDPCMGSGHILVVLFDTLVQIYEAYGYSTREAASMIVENNLWGLDIDERAAQLSYFAVMMKARQYDRRFFSRKLQPHVYAIAESNDIDEFTLEYFVNGDSNLKKNMSILMEELRDAKEYGSILNVTMVDFPALYARLAEVEKDISMHRESALNTIRPLIQAAEALAQKYSVTCTNPPYMGASGMSAKLSDFVKKNYPDSKSDLFAVFIERCGQMTQQNGYRAMITQHAWMFLSSFEKLRVKLLAEDIVNMAHLGARAFEEIGGEVVQTTSFVIRKSRIADYKGTYCRLIEPTSQQGKEDMFLRNENRYMTKQNDFSKIPGKGVIYWASQQLIFDFEKMPKLGNLYRTLAGSSTGDNSRFLRMWQEVESEKIGFHISKNYDGKGYKWIPTLKGGGFQRWYGNFDYVMNWSNDGEEIKYWVTHNPKDPNTKSWSRRLFNTDLYFHEGLTWSKITTGRFSARYMPEGFIMESASCGIMPSLEEQSIVLAVLNSKVAQSIIDMFNPTVNIQVGDIMNIPINADIHDDSVEILVKSNIQNVASDWDSYETSWDFKRHPLVSNQGSVIRDQSGERKTDHYPLTTDHCLSGHYPLTTDHLKMRYDAWKEDCELRFQQLKKNEEELNRIFIGIYGLQDELTPDVADKDITVHRIFDTKDDIPESMRTSNYVRTMRDEVVSLISYAVGCMFGRYSLDVDGLAYAGGTFSDQWIVVSGQYYKREVVEKYVSEELQRTLGMAEINADCGGNISSGETAAKRGIVCFVRSDAPSSCIHSFQYRRGTSEKFYEGICELSFDSQGIHSRTGNTVYDLCSPEILAAIANGTGDELVKRGWKDAECIDWKAIHCTLTTNHYYPDRDNIIPICDDEYFDDDIVSRFVEFVRVVYGAETLEENLKFIADALGGKGSAREVIRSYFINDFYKDHCKTYQKRPIYWLFDSGKKGGFKALIYMHRYQPDTIARIRTDYVHEQQSRYRTEIADLQQRMGGASTGDRVKLTKQLTKLEAQAEEIRTYEEKIHHLADQMIPIDLDDGVKVNYAKFADVLAKIK